MLNQLNKYKGKHERIDNWISKFQTYFSVLENIRDDISCLTLKKDFNSLSKARFNPEFLAKDLEIQETEILVDFMYAQYEEILMPIWVTTCLSCYIINAENTSLREIDLKSEFICNNETCRAIDNCTLVLYFGFTEKYINYLLNNN